MDKRKVTDEDVERLCNKLEIIIKRKRETNNQQIPIDDEVLGFISVSRYAAQPYKDSAKKWLIQFCNHASIGLD